MEAERNEYHPSASIQEYANFMDVVHSMMWGCKYKDVADFAECIDAGEPKVFERDGDDELVRKPKYRRRSSSLDNG